VKVSGRCQTTRAASAASIRRRRPNGRHLAHRRAHAPPASHDCGFVGGNHRPIDRADILTGARFDFKVEFPGLVDPAKISVTLNGEDHAKLFGKAATFVERETARTSPR
jgi:hypothetical protein